MKETRKTIQYPSSDKAARADAIPADIYEAGELPIGRETDRVVSMLDWLPSYVQYLPIISCPMTKTFFLVAFTSLLKLSHKNIESYVKICMFY